MEYVTLGRTGLKVSKIVWAESPFRKLMQRGQEYWCINFQTGE